MSSGTQQFWIIDSEKRTVQVTALKETKLYAADNDDSPAGL
jgi:hypothetical protein